MIKPQPHHFDNMEGASPELLIEWIDDARGALYGGEPTDACMPSHAIDFAAAVLYQNSDSEAEIARHLDFVIQELSVLRSNLRKG